MMGTARRRRWRLRAWWERQRARRRRRRCRAPPSSLSASLTSAPSQESHNASLPDLSLYREKVLLPLCTHIARARKRTRSWRKEAAPAVPSPLRTPRTLPPLQAAAQPQGSKSSRLHTHPSNGCYRRRGSGRSPCRFSAWRGDHHQHQHCAHVAPVVPSDGGGHGARVPAQGLRGQRVCRGA